MGSAAHLGNALVDETSGDVLYVNPQAGWVMRSRDQGRTWAREAITSQKPDGFDPAAFLAAPAALCARWLRYRADRRYAFRYIRRRSGPGLSSGGEHDAGPNWI